MSAMSKPAPPNAAAKSNSRLALFWLALPVVAALVLICFGLQARKHSRGTVSQNGGSTNAVYADYGGSESCRECHEEAYAAWKTSHHALAERMPDPGQENPAFIPARSFHHGTQQTTLRTNGGHYELLTAGLSGSNETFVVDRILGENPLRQMLIDFPGGRVQVTEAAWDPRSNDWFNVYSNEDRKPGEWGNWLGRGMNWNSMCAICHNTRLLKNYDTATDTYQTIWLEHGVGCESCHGPMRGHNDWQHANKGKGLADPNLKKLTRDQNFEYCAGCHSRRGEITGDPLPGQSYWDHHLLSTVDESELFYPDGQIHDEDYEFTAFLGSAMCAKGVRCMDCHDVHSMKTRLPGNFLCLGCHGAGATNAPAINPVAHSHHKVYGFDTNGILQNPDLLNYKSATVKETGGECVNCHMPQTPYMVRHWRHDHGFTSPDPLLTKQFGIPNACERCHADKGTDWNLQYVEQWYGTNMNRPYRLRAQAVARAKQGDASAREPLVRMLASDGNPYWRAVAANMLQRWLNEPSVVAALSTQLQDTNALVRQMVVQSLGLLAEEGRPDIVSSLEKKLSDSSRNVRMVAARHLAATLDTNSPVGVEYLRFLDDMADQPLGQMQIGAFMLMRGDPTNALRHFETAVKWDPYSPGIRHELAIVLSQLGRSAEAVRQLETAVKFAPNEAEFHYKLALALNETGETARVLTELDAAVKCDPRHARAWYNLGLARNARGDVAGALEALTRGASADPADPRIPYARATILVQQGKIAEARAAARRALEIEPNFAPAAELLNQIGR
jgi:Flp pilus assembly protein TadD